MLYLASKTRTFLSFAVNHCARFTQNTKSSHETVTKRICQYLQGTKDKGMVFNTSRKMALDFYFDAYFTEPWGYGYPQNHIFARNRTVFVVNFTNSPLFVGVKNTSRDLFFCSIF